MMARGIPLHQDQPHAVYVIRGAGDVLYVGMARDPEHRIYMHHIAYSHWTQEHYDVEVEWCADRGAARERERHLIETLRPRDNKQHRVVGPWAAETVEAAS